MKKHGEALALLLGVPKGESKDDAGSELKDAARDVLDAIKDDDADALALALQRVMSACDDGDEDEDDQDDSEKE